MNRIPPVICSMFLLPVMLFAQAGNWADHRDTAWYPDTSLGATNRIGTAAELAQFAWLVNSGIHFFGTVTLITNTVNLSPHLWTPAGVWDHPFTGTLAAEPDALLDGLTIHDADLDNAGLFGYIGAYGYVASITLTNVAITARDHIGAIAGNNLGTIANCMTYGTINGSSTGYFSVGGIAGNDLEGMIANCVNHITITANDYIYVGGIVGQTGHGSRVANCRNHGMIVGTTSAGGIAGASGGTIADCVNYRDLSCTGIAFDERNAGGIAGVNFGTITDCVNHGDIARSGVFNSGLPVIRLFGCYAGGIAGYNENGKIVNSVNHGAINGSYDVSVGGIAGYNENGKIANCLNCGDIAGISNAGNHSGIDIGGIVGLDIGMVANCVNHGGVTGSGPASIGGIAGESAGGITNCYWNTNITANASLPAVGNGASASCAAFSGAPGTFDTSVMIGDFTTTTDLLTALNAWSTPSSFWGGTLPITPFLPLAFASWTLINSPDGYPHPILADDRWDHESRRDLTWCPSTTLGATNRIGTAAELAQFAWLVNTGNNFVGTTTVITNSINLSAHYWTPVGTNDTVTFSGMLTAEPGVSLDGLTINDATLRFIGLLGFINFGARVESIILTNTTMHAVCPGYANAYIGIVAGLSRQSVIANCANHGTLIDYNNPVNGHFIGGIVGHNENSVMDNCINMGSVIGGYSADYVGGIAGENSSGGTVMNCVNHGVVNGIGSFAIGGIAGNNSSGSTLANCINRGVVNGVGSYFVGGIAGNNLDTIANCANHNTVNSDGIDSNSDVGGIAGRNEHTLVKCVNHGTINGYGNGSVAAGGIAGSGGRISDSENHGMVNGASFGPSSVYSGGIVGINHSSPIENCINYGTISSTSDYYSYISDYAYGGGIMGCNYGSIENCVNHGVVKVNDSYASDPAGAICKYIGGIAGYSSGTIANCYWHINGMADTPLPAVGDGALNNCASFSDAPGTFNTAVTVGMISTFDLLFAINAWVADQATSSVGVSHTFWTLLKSPNGFPRLITCHGNWADEPNRDTHWQPSFANGSTNFIATAGQLAQFVWLINSGNDFADTVTVLTDSIDLSAHYWTPNDTWFSGMLIAMPGVLIDGLTIIGDMRSNAGFFGVIGGRSRVDSLMLTNTIITVTAASRANNLHAGAIAGFSYGTIVNCENRGTISGYGNYYGDVLLGGLVGYSDGSVENCISHGSVRAVSSSRIYAGGISGKHDSGILINCVNYCDVSTSCMDYDYSVCMGGIAGYQDNGVIADCVNHGTIIGLSANASSDINIGGIMGGGNYSAARTVNCTNYGAIIGSGMFNNIYIGGIAGYAGQNRVANCANRGSVDCSGSGNIFIGGIAGHSGLIANCVNYGLASGIQTGYSNVLIGGIAGFNDYLLENCYWNTNMANASLTVVGDGFSDNCEAFADVPGHFATDVTVDGITTHSLLAALNAWVAAASAVAPVGISYSPWTLCGSPDGYPQLAIYASPVPIPVNGSTANMDIGLPSIILPFGGFYAPGSGTLTDHCGMIVYSSSQSGAVITAIEPSGENVTLTLAPDAILFGKSALDEPAWTYLNRSSGVTFLDNTAKITPAAGNFRFFTARQNP